MKAKSPHLFCIWLMLALLLAACPGKQLKKVFYINSYHEGYGSSDDVMAGIQHELEGKANLRIAYMDTKRQSQPEIIERTSLEIRQEIDDFMPDVIIASDDNAIKYIIEPYFIKRSIPVVFCGVNWTAAQYQLPRKHITGMLEVIPFSETVQTVKQSFTDIKELTVLSENTTSEQKNMEVMQPIFDSLALKAQFFLVNNFEEWKSAFIHANENADIIYLPTNGAIKGWNKEEAVKLVEQNIKIPVITCDDFMMPYAVFGLTKIAGEQGEWAAKSAQRILQGVKPSDIPISKNRNSRAWLNKRFAEKIGFQLSGNITENITILDN